VQDVRVELGRYKGQNILEVSRQMGEAQKQKQQKIASIFGGKPILKSGKPAPAAATTTTTTQGAAQVSSFVVTGVACMSRSVCLSSFTSL